MTIEIRRLGAGDAAVLATVADEVFDEPIRPDRAAAHLATPASLMVVAIADGVVVGQAAGVIHTHPDKPTEFYIDEVGTAAGWRRQGIARRMLAELIAWGRERGAEEAWVGTETDNIAARRLYEERPPAEVSDFVMYLWEL